MRRFTTCLAGSLIVFSCSTAENKKTSSTVEPSIYSTNFVDYALSIQNQPHSTDFKKVLDRYLFLTDSVGYTGVPMRRSLEISLAENDSVLLYGFTYHSDSIKEKCFQYLTFKNFWKDYSSLHVGFENPFGQDTLYYSKGLFDIAVYNDSFSYQDLQNVTIQISEAIVEYKWFLGQNWFGKSYHKLTEEEVNLIDSIVGLRIQIYEFPKP